MPRLSVEVRECLRLFAFYLGNGTVDMELLGDEQDYSSLVDNPSDLEHVFAIWSNVLEITPEGEMINSNETRKRAAQYIRQFIDPAYVVDPPFSDWEIELH